MALESPETNTIRTIALKTTSVMAIKLVQQYIFFVQMSYRFSEARRVVSDRVQMRKRSFILIHLSSLENG